MNFNNIQYHRSEKALKLINSDVFIKQWQQLAIEFSGTNRMQEAEILCTWYRHYAKVFEPVLFTAFDDSHELVGFLGMVWDERNQELKHAGHPHYQGWLTKPEYEISFLQKVFRFIYDDFPVKEMFWSGLSPDLSSEVIGAALGPDMYMTVQKIFTPIWDLRDPERLQKLLKNRNIKNQFNQYKRRGDFRFEVIREPEQFRKVLHIVKNQIDFRHEAINNVRPFEVDSIKIDYYCAQMAVSKTLLPVTLWLNEQLLAFNLGIISKDRYIGRMLSFDPSENKLSPGTLLLIKLAEHLLENGFNIYDPTPGLDTYKDRFANTKVILHKPTIYFSKIDYQKNKLKQQLYSNFRKLVIEKLGFNINKFRRWKINNQEIPLKIQNLKKSKFTTIVKKGFTLFDRPKLCHLDQNNIPAGAHATVGRVKVQQYEDLLKYNDTYPFLTRRGLLVDAQEKFSKGNILYSVADDKNLLWYIWQKKVSGEFKVRNNSFSIEKAGVLLYDWYRSSNINEEKINQNMSEIVHLLNSQDIENIYLI